MSYKAQVAALLAIAVAYYPSVFAQKTASQPETFKAGAVLVSLSNPVYPPLARQARITGEVSVAVTVHTDGTTSAVVESGHPMLIPAALDSATRSHFECHMCNGSVPYLLVFTFKEIAGNDCCTAFSQPQQVEQEQQLEDQQGRPRTHVVISAQGICLCDPGAELTKRVRSLKCLYLWKCSVE